MNACTTWERTRCRTGQEIVELLKKQLTSPVTWLNFISVGLVDASVGSSLSIAVFLDIYVPAFPAPGSAKTNKEQSGVLTICMHTHAEGTQVTHRASNEKLSEELESSQAFALWICEVKQRSTRQQSKHPEQADSEQLSITWKQQLWICRPCSCASRSEGNKQPTR